MRSAGAGARTVVGIMAGVLFVLLTQTLENSGQVYGLNPLLVAWGPTASPDGPSPSSPSGECASRGAARARGRQDPAGSGPPRSKEDPGEVEYERREECRRPRRLQPVDRPPQVPGAQRRQQGDAGPGRKRTIAAGQPSPAAGALKFEAPGSHRKGLAAVGPAPAEIPEHDDQEHRVVGVGKRALGRARDFLAIRKRQHRKCRHDGERDHQQRVVEEGG